MRANPNKQSVLLAVCIGLGCAGRDAAPAPAPPAAPVAQPQTSAPAEPAVVHKRFDELVRDDFFAGLQGDAAAFERAMTKIESTLEVEPDHPEALVWRGSGVLFRAGQRFRDGDAQQGIALWQEGLAQMARGVELSPDNVGVRIGRGATLMGVYRFDPNPQTRDKLLRDALSDYEAVLALQAEYFDTLSVHARGELLAGLGEGWHHAGDKDRARGYFERIQRDLPDSPYAVGAEAWMDPAIPDAERKSTTCTGCHTQ